MNRNLVLCYHAVSTTWTAPLSVRPEQFERQIRLVLSRGYRPVTFSELTQAPRDAGLVAVTFDDAFRSVHTLALPALSRLGVPATIFVPTDPVEASRPLAWDGTAHWLQTRWASELTPMSWGELRAVAAAGWEIGSHTRTHPHLPVLGPETLSAELVESREMCERRMECPCTSFAYPYGDLDARVVSAAGSAGYTSAAALPGDFGRLDPLQWPRIGVYHRDDERRFRLKISSKMLRLRTGAMWDLAVDRRRRAALVAARQRYEN
jgi:peptidoglycan/xylan/chitin deacetylase (PgdA/CDA1 family)